VDYIIASDVIWIEELIEPLVRSMEVLATENTVILLAYQSRSFRADAAFFGYLTESFVWSEAPRFSDQDPVFSRGRVKMYRIQRKKTN